VISLCDPAAAAGDIMAGATRPCDPAAAPGAHGADSASSALPVHRTTYRTAAGGGQQGRWVDGGGAELGWK
jgi:hypothetical protein